MTKSEVISLLGKPYKSAFMHEKDSSFLEKLYYKEVLWNGTHYFVNSILSFKDQRLLSLKQGREYPLNQNSNFDETFGTDSN